MKKIIFLSFLLLIEFNAYTMNKLVNLFKKCSFVASDEESPLIDANQEQAAEGNKIEVVYEKGILEEKILCDCKNHMLPDELWLAIFAYLEPRNFAQLDQVSKCFRKKTVLFSLWKWPKVSIKALENIASPNLNELLVLHKIALEYEDSEDLGKYLDFFKFTQCAINIKDQDGDTALLIAVLKKKKKFVEVLLSKGALVNVMDNEKASPLYWAIRKQDKEIFELLIKNGAYIDNEWCFSFAAVKDGDGNDSYFLERILELDRKDLLKYTIGKINALSGAVERNKPKYVEWICTKIADKSYTDNERTLFLNKADNEFGDTALHKACKNEKKNAVIISTLLRAGIDHQLTNKKKQKAIDLIDKNDQQIRLIFLNFAS